MVLLEDVDREDASALLGAERRRRRARHMAGNDLGEDPGASRLSVSSAFVETSTRPRVSRIGTYEREPDVSDFVSIGRVASDCK